ncbi:MAG: TetR/AcrR family transcriptional regulator [Cytophagales bacterium]|nr:TetR/AcrR family transcriptional regulator [Cytophagales bacterium]
MFFKYGLRSVTMDQIACEIGISKKTLYEIFENKKELVKCVIEEQLEKEERNLCVCVTGSENVVQQMYRQCLHLRKQMKEVNPVLTFELRKFFPEIWERLQMFKKGLVLNWIRGTLEQGKFDGFFRPELDSTVLAALRYYEVGLGLREDFLDPETVELNKVQDLLFDHFLHGILTAKGRQLYEHYKRTEFNEIN